MQITNNFVFLDSERSDECIGFTMICVYFLCLFTLFRVIVVLRYLTSRMVFSSEFDINGNFKRSFLKIFLYQNVTWYKIDKKLRKKRENV